MVLNQKLKNEEIEAVLKANNALLDELSVDQHHDAIAGTAQEYVTMDYQVKLSQAELASKKPTYQFI